MDEPKTDRPAIAGRVVISEADVTVDGVSLPWMISEDIAVRTLVQDDGGSEGALHVVTLQLFADAVEIVAPLRRPIEHTVEVSTVTVRTDARVPR